MYSEILGCPHTVISPPFHTTQKISEIVDRRVKTGVLIRVNGYRTGYGVAVLSHVKIMDISRSHLNHG